MQEVKEEVLSDPHSGGLVLFFDLFLDFVKNLIPYFFPGGIVKLYLFGTARGNGTMLGVNGGAESLVDIENVFAVCFRRCFHGKIICLKKD